MFAVSGNQCYFPNCKNSLVDKESGKVTCKICHIKCHSSTRIMFNYNTNDLLNMGDLLPREDGREKELKCINCGGPPVFEYMYGRIIV